jgi:DNA-directed RNA polymerase subunit omega
MRSELVHRALSKVANPQILINVVSKRVRQLGLGYRPMIAVSPRMTFMDVALHEIADGKLGYEVIGGEAAEVAAKPARKTRAKKSA